MFLGANAFNQNIRGWNVDAVVTKPPTDFSTGSDLTEQNSPVWFPIVLVLDANGTTIKYVGSVPTLEPMFIQANPRGTGMEWFAVVKQSMKAAISSYASGTDGPFKPTPQLPVVPFNNIVTTLMTDMSGLFNSKSGFNAPIASWDTSNVINMAYLFANTLTNGFNQPIGAWNTSNVRNMDAMFYNSGLFNQAIGAWNTGAVTNMSGMFWSANAFNQPIGTWNTGAVTNMSYMFKNASAFNQNISGWNVAAVVTKPPTDFSTGSDLTEQNSPGWATWTFTYFSGVYAGTSVPTQQLLSDGSNSQSSGWGSLPVNNPYIQADFGSAKTISSIIVGPINEYGWDWSTLNGAALQVSSDGTNWSNVISSIQADTSLPTKTYSQSVSTRYVRIIYLDSNTRYLSIGTFNFTFA
jgi:surface protein